MSVVVLCEGTPLVDTLDEATTAAHALKSELLVVATAARASFSADAWVSAYAAILEPLTPSLVFVADGPHTRAYFPQLAAKLRKALLSGATRVRVTAKDEVEVERSLHGGLQTERLVVALPLMVTLSLSGTTPARFEATRQIEPNLDNARDVVEKVVPPNDETVDIRLARRIVAGGLGLGSKEGVVMLERLAARLHAAVGGTRVISDRGWIEHDRYIGSTGKSVAPKLYIALGISGASQHLVGMTESEAVIAINTDRGAPIFSVADLGIVGDLNTIVPELEKRLPETTE